MHSDMTGLDSNWMRALSLPKLRQLENHIPVGDSSCMVRKVRAEVYLLHLPIALGRQ